MAHHILSTYLLQHVRLCKVWIARAERLGGRGALGSAVKQTRRARRWTQRSLTSCSQPVLQQPMPHARLSGEGQTLCKESTGRCGACTSHCALAGVRSAHAAHIEQAGLGMSRTAELRAAPYCDTLGCSPAEVIAEYAVTSTTWLPSLLVARMQVNSWLLPPRTPNKLTP